MGRSSSTKPTPPQGGGIKILVRAPLLPLVSRDIEEAVVTDWEAEVCKNLALAATQPGYSSIHFMNLNISLLHSIAWFVIVGYAVS